MTDRRFTIPPASAWRALVAILVVLAPKMLHAAPDRDALIERYCLRGDFFRVTTTEDVEDEDGCTDDHCTLREALNAGNACPMGTRAIISLSDETYPLRLQGFEAPIFDGEGWSQSALPVVADVIIFGNGARIRRASEIDRLFRVFEVREGAALSLVEVTVSHGAVGPASGGGSS